MHDRRGHARVPATRPLRLRSPFALLAVLVSAALLLAACDPTPSNTPSASPGGVLVTPVATVPAVTESAIPSEAVVTPPPTLPPAVAEPCTVADLKASHGLVEGAAGSRLTEIVLVAGIACSVDAFPLLGLRDADGNPLVGGAPTGSGRIDLVPGEAYASVARLANWCQDEPAFPLSLEIRIGSEALPVTGESFPQEGDLPPCNGEGGAILEAGAWIASGSVSRRDPGTAGGGRQARGPGARPACRSAGSAP